MIPAQIRPFGGGNQRGGRGPGGFGGKSIGQRPGGPSGNKGADFRDGDRFNGGNLDALPAIPDDADRIPGFNKGGFKLPFLASGRKGVENV